jgi:hypothetical protein
MKLLMPRCESPSMIWTRTTATFSIEAINNIRFMAFLPNAAA